MSNFLGGEIETQRLTSILSAAELMVREGINLQKGMNFRKEGDMPSVFLVLPTHDGEYSDAWNALTGVYTFEGHDSTTVEAGGKSKDQLLMYESGKVTDNGKFYKVANEYKDGLRESPVPIQVYEKIDAGVWFDKGYFDLVAAHGVIKDERKIYQFDLRPIGVADEERMLSVTQKIAVWQSDDGHCHDCKTESGLRFVSNTDRGIHLLCAVHAGMSRGLLG